MLKKSFCIVMAVFGIIAGTAAAQPLKINVSQDAMSANGMIRYQVPADAPEKIQVKARYHLGDNQWKNPAVNAYRSESVMQRIVATNVIAEEQKASAVTELFAAGRVRTMVWKTFPDLPYGKKVAGVIELTVLNPADNQVIARGSAPFNFDFSKVVVLNKFANNPEIHPDIVLTEKPAKGGGWYETANGLDCVETGDPLEPLAWRPQLSGKYAIYMHLPITGYSLTCLRLSRDGFAQRFDSVDGYEQFWKVADLTNQHIIIQDFYAFLSRVGDHARARLSYIKCVPVTDAAYKEYMDKFYPAQRDKFIAAFFEPYSWSFNELVRDNNKFAEPMAAYAEARVDLVDSQCGRNGMKPLFPNTFSEPLLGGTRGDAHVTKEGKVVPGTYSLGTGRMGRLVDSLYSSVKYAKNEGLLCSINFGAGPSYTGHPLGGDFAQKHPELAVPGWKDFLHYKHPEVIAHYMKHFKAALDAGAKCVTVNFKTYPHGVTDHTQSRAVLRELRKLADNYTVNGEKVKIMVLFPIPGSKGVTFDNNYRPADWIREGLVDILVAAALTDTDIYYFDPTPYVKMVKNTKVKLLVEFSGSACSPIFPYEPLKLADRFYDAGVDGLYIYQADARIVGSMSGKGAEERRWVSLLGNSQNVKDAIRELEAKQNEYSVDVVTNFTYLFQSYRAQMQVDGLDVKKMNLKLIDKDGNVKVESNRTAWPWTLGEGGHSNHYPVGGPFTIKIEAEDGNGNKLVKEFAIPRINRSVSF
ncbi:MAG: hypothetical protein E7056_07715 [Lentisphaerae bacterium]|nr:hypothetical protein [Lentisphaerota bacterium]